MPLVGTICCQTGQPEKFSVCEERCRQGGCDHALPILVNMRKDGERRKNVGVSSSTLAGCPRQFVLGQSMGFYENPEDYYARWLGTIGHYAIEMDGPYPGVIQETRFYREIEVDGSTVVLSGQPDWIDTNGDSLNIDDHKIVGGKPKEARQEHVAQLNVYRWLVEGGYVGSVVLGKEFEWYRGEGENPIPPHLDVEQLRLHYYHPGKGSRHTEFDVMIWTDEAVERYVRASLRPIEHYVKTGRWQDIGVSGQQHAWRAKYCPFRHECNGSRCCQLPIGLEPLTEA